MIQKIRSFLFTVYLPVTAVLCFLALFPTLFFRRGAFFTARLWSKLSMFGLKFLCGIDYQIKGEEHLPSDAGFFAANHQSMWETFMLVGYFKKPVFVLKKELMIIPVFGWFCRACGFIAIDREGGSAAMRQMLAQAKQRIDEGCQVIIFPEGSRKRPGEPGEYHPGVAGLYSALGIPCTPIAHNSGVYWHHPSNLRVPGTITLTFLPPIEAGKKRGAFLKELQAVIKTASNDLVTQEDPKNRPSDRSD